jgi:Holliday junction DNA helicase RuvA
MIGALRGRLLLKEPPLLLVDVQGVGYEVEAPASTFDRLPEPGAEVSLRTHLVIREDQHLLFGFATEAERHLFRDLIKVNGVGARTALAILSSLSVAAFAAAVQASDAAALTRVPGVGRKTAERLIVDLRDRVPAVTVPATGGEPAARDGSATREAYEALLALGYRPAEARQLIDQVQAPAGGKLAAAELLRAALRAAAVTG